MDFLENMNQVILNVLLYHIYEVQHEQSLML